MRTSKGWDDLAVSVSFSLFSSFSSHSNISILFSSILVMKEYESRMKVILNDMQNVFVKKYKHFFFSPALFRSQIGFQSWHKSSLWATHRSRHHQVCWYVCNINRWTEWGRVDGVNKNSIKTDSLALDIFATKNNFNMCCQGQLMFSNPCHKHFSV